MKRILILGDNQRAVYHPLDRMLPGMEKALAGYEILAVTDYLTMNAQELTEAAPLMISYIDNYQENGNFDEVLEEYLRLGGKIIALHCGLINREGSILEEAYGGNFITHPAYRNLHYSVSGDCGWISAGSFSFGEEPYQIRQTLGEKKHFLAYTDDEGECTDTAGWVRKYHRGAVMYLQPGHDERTADNTDFQQMLRECVEYLQTL